MQTICEEQDGLAQSTRTASVNLPVLYKPPGDGRERNGDATCPGIEAIRAKDTKGSEQMSGLRIRRESHSYGPVDTDLAIAAVHLIAVPSGGSETVEIPFPLLSSPIKRFQCLDQAVHTKPGRAIYVIQARPDDFVAAKADCFHSIYPPPFHAADRA
jgi:hypothetical protein